MKHFFPFASIAILLSACSSNGVLDEHKFNLIAQEISSNQLSCETIADSSVFQPEPQNIGEIAFKLTKGTDRIALTIGDEYLSIITAASVKNGTSESEKWPIIEEDEEHVIAGNFRRSALGSSLYSFALNKKTGFAVWTKVEPSFLYVPAAGGFIQYLTCK